MRFHGTGCCPFFNKPCANVHSGNLSDLDVFFAYSAHPERRAEAIQGAIERIRNEALAPKVLDWRELDIEGSLIFCAICEAIQTSRLLVADITGLNFNVLFELGFAIGIGTPIWPLVEESSSGIPLYARLATLTTVGHSRYRHSKDIATKLLKKRRWARGTRLPCPLPIHGEPTRNARQLLFLRSPSENEASLRISEAVDQVAMHVVDDPSEIFFQPISWYVDRLSTSYAVLIDLGDSSEEDGLLHHAKCALVAGMAVSSGRRVLILGDNIDIRPVDYHDLLQTYKNAAHASSLAHSFLSTVKQKVNSLDEEIKNDITPLPEPEVPIIRKIQLGDYLAENELSDLRDYFIETPEYEDACRGGFKVFTGRKGTGKSAMANMVAEYFATDARQIVKLLNPKGYELTQIMDVVQRFSRPTQGRFLEALWKYMLSMEALAAISQIIKYKPIDTSWSVAEEKIKEFSDNNAEILSLSFASRLLAIIQRQMLRQQTEAVPENVIIAQLQSQEISAIRELLCEYLSHKDRRLTIIVDGLVASWDTPAERRLMSEILLSLFNGAQELWREWQNRVEGNHKLPMTTILLFFRSDIFASMLERADEPDKVTSIELFWDDAESLLQVINRRIVASICSDEERTLNWQELLEPGFQPEEMRDMLVSNILYRPRDIIYYFQRVLFHANRRRGSSLIRRDFMNALQEYSEYALQALSAEWSIAVPNTGDLLLGFWAGQSILSFGKIREVLLANNVINEDIDEAVRFLVDSQFLGLAIDDNNFKFALTPIQSHTMMRQAGRFIHDRGGARRFKIHNAFQQSLALTDGKTKRGETLRALTAK